MNTAKLRWALVAGAVVVTTATPAAADPELRVGLLGGIARSLEDTPRHGGSGHVRARFEGCGPVFLCAVNLSLVGGYGIDHAGGVQQWFGWDLGMRLDSIALYTSLGFSGMLADYDRDRLNVSFFSPRMGAGVRLETEDFTVVAEGHVSYLWRWFGDDVPMAGIELGILLPVHHPARAEPPVEVSRPYAAPPSVPVEIAN